jgi:hypothetical protein
MLQCVIDTAKITVVDGDYVLYIPPTGTWDTRNCSICYVNSGGKRVSIRGAFNQSAKCDGYTFGSIHETFEANTWGGSDDCCNGYYAGGVKEASSCVSLYGSTGGETLMKCGYKTDWHVQRITYGPRADGYFYGEDCFLVKETAAPGSPESVCMLPKAQRVAGKCIAGNVVTCEFTPKQTTCTEGCFEDTTGAHCTEFDAACTVSAPPSVCGGSSIKVTVSCKNGGNQPWDANLELVTLPQTSDSPIADASWISPRVPAAVSSAPIAPAASGTFTFTLRAPKTTTKTTVTQALALEEKGASAPFAKPAPFSLSIEVDPCTGDGGVGEDGGTDGGDASTNGDAPSDVNGGCACSTPGASRRSSDVGAASCFGLVTLGFGVVLRRRACRPRSRRSITAPHPRG